MNDLGVLEVITDDLLCNETLNTSDELEESGKDKEDVKVKTEPETVAIKEGNPRTSLANIFSLKLQLFSYPSV